MQPVLAYITAKDKVEAHSIGRLLLERRLAACVNILPQMESLYRWEGKIESSAEAVLIAKTDTEKTQGLMDCVKEVHSYSVPCILILPVSSGYQPYMEWLSQNLET